MLQTGVNLEYDQALRQAAGRQTTPQLLASMIEEGFLPQLMLGTDGARRSLWRTLGGSPGLAYLAAGYAEVLDAHGIGHNELRALFVANPARWLACATT
jgi:predicted metal-dependent phosphotriesterase family hydrolase